LLSHDTLTSDVCDDPDIRVSAAQVGLEAAVAASGLRALLSMAMPLFSNTQMQSEP
jgi:hypothetical protein